MTGRAIDQRPDLDRRFGGLARLYGTQGAARIHAAHVVVVGAGGVGSWAVEALARSGVGRLTLIDLDHVSESNINRQLQATDATLGQAKVQALAERIALINPTCEVHCIEEFVDAGNWPALLPPDADAVIDACDQVAAKTVMAAWSRTRVAARKKEKPILFITVGAAGGKRFAHEVQVDDLARVTHDPLLAQLRYRLRKAHGAPKEGRKMDVICVFSRETVQDADPSCAVDDGGQSDGSLNCSGYGSLVSVTATFGFCAAGWVLSELSKERENRL